MARFTNVATLSYSGGAAESNVVTGEILEVLSANKTAVSDNYAARDSVTYVVSLVNSGAAALTGLTVTDDLGGYSFGGGTVYPLAYRAGSLRYYVNGVLQASPGVEAGPPLTVTGVSVPAGGNALLIYEADVTNYAPLGVEARIINTASVTGGGISAPLTATSTVAMENRADLRIRKALSPAAVVENGRVTYTFVIENLGSLPAAAADAVVLTDTFDPRLNAVSVTFNDTPWAANTNYTYNEATGIFSTRSGQITVPAATYTQNADGTWKVTPGTSTLVVTGNI